MPNERAAEASIQFLKRWNRNGPWVITALDPDEGYIRTRAFGPDDVEAMRAFILEWRRKRNLYFQPNPDLRPVADITTKARKDHMAAAITLQVDIDGYKVDEDREAGKARVLHTLIEELPEGIPGPPSIINSSGNGFNCFWLLREPFVLDGDIEKALEVERYNRGLAQAFGGDKTTDVNRLMRLPWSINWPNETKRRLGLVPIMARQVKFDSGVRYDLSDFPTVEGGRAGDPKREALITAKHKIGAPVGIASIDELDVPERTKVIIEFGSYPGEERKSRSEWLFAAIISMIRAGEADETILGVITDTPWEISHSVLEKPDPQTYARRQIARAHAWLSVRAEEEFDDE